MYWPMAGSSNWILDHLLGICKNDFPCLHTNRTHWQCYLVVLVYCSFGWDLRVDSWSKLRATKDPPTGSFSFPGVSECGINIKRLSKRKTKQKSTYPKPPNMSQVTWTMSLFFKSLKICMFLHKIVFIFVQCWHNKDISKCQTRMHSQPSDVALCANLCTNM